MFRLRPTAQFLRGSNWLSSYSISSDFPNVSIIISNEDSTVHIFLNMQTSY